MIFSKSRITFFTLFFFSMVVLHAQQTEKKSKYIYPTIESDSVFQNAIHSQEYVVVDFWAVWCRPCHLFLPEYEKIAKQFHKKVAFYKLNVDNCPLTVQEYKLQMIPVVIIFKKGEEVKRYVGLTSKERIIFDLEGIINKK